MGLGTWTVGLGTWTVGLETWTVGLGAWVVGLGTWKVGLAQDTQAAVNLIKSLPTPHMILSSVNTLNSLNVRDDENESN